MDCVPAYLNMCEIELINPARVEAYMKAGLGPPGLNIMPLDPRAYQRADGTPFTYVSPMLDPAPWYDPIFPESANLLGFIAAMPSGYDGTTTREITARMGDLGGASFSGEQRIARTHDWTVTVVASTIEAAEYGKLWLKSMLGAGCDACMTCDTIVRLSLGADYETGRWLQYEVALTGGPVFPTEMQLVPTGTFTLTAGNPYLYREPVWALEQATLQGDDGVIGCIPFDQWFCGSLETDDVCLTIDRTPVGEVAPILLLDASGGSVDGAKVLMYDDCPEGQPGTNPRGVLIPKLEQGWSVTIDSAKGIINAITPAGELVNGSRLVETIAQGSPFMRVSNCDNVRCMCVGVEHPCGGGQDVLVSLATQWRTL